MASLGQPTFYYQTADGPKPNPVTPAKIAKLKEICDAERKRHNAAKDILWGAEDREITPCRAWQYAMKQQVVIAECIAARKERERQELIIKVHELEMERSLLNRWLATFRKRD